MKTLPVSYIGMYESVAGRRRDGASSEAPCHAGADPRFPCEASFTRLKIVFHSERGMPRGIPRHIRSAAAAATVVAAAPAAAGRGVRAVAAAAAQQAAVSAEAAQQDQENQPAANAVIAVTSHD